LILIPQKGILNYMIPNPTVQQVTSLDHPGLQPYRTLRRPVDHIREGIFVAEGEKVVRRLLASPLSVISFLLTDEWYDRLSPELAEHPCSESFVCHVGPKPLLESIVGFNLHQGIMAVARVPVEPSLPALLKELPEPWLIVALDGLVNAENVGVVVRNSAAFGASAIIAGPTSSSPYLRRAVRNSMGTVFTMPVIHVTDLPETLRSIHGESGGDVIGTDLDGELIGPESGMEGNVCLVMGNEGEGITAPVLAACTRRVAIPMSNGTDSLNVASASAVFCYEVRRRQNRLMLNQPSPTISLFAKK
jgi:tRNA G18 (ribose-2'-O)-methylase SpoU